MAAAGLLSLMATRCPLSSWGAFTLAGRGRRAGRHAGDRRAGDAGGDRRRAAALVGFSRADYRHGGGLLVLLITVLVADRVVRLRQINSRARAVAAQAAILVKQAIRSTRAVSQALAGSGDRDAAGDEFRTYMMMLLVGAPVLIDATVSRNFLEQAQSLGGEMARALAATARTPGQADYPAARLDDAVRRLRTASTPLLQVLNPETRLVVLGDQSG